MTFWECVGIKCGILNALCRVITSIRQQLRQNDGDHPLGTACILQFTRLRLPLGLYTSAFLPQNKNKRIHWTSYVRTFDSVNITCIIVLTPESLLYLISNLGQDGELNYGCNSRAGASCPSNTSRGTSYESSGGKNPQFSRSTKS